MRNTIVVLDFDGVINTTSRKHKIGTTFKRDIQTTIDNFEINASRQMIREINSIDCPVFWMSTWGSQMKEVCENLNIRTSKEFRTIPFEQIKDSDYAKCEAMTEFSKKNAESTIIWVDDTATKKFPIEGNIICITPNEKTGITIEQMREIKKFL